MEIVSALCKALADKVGQKRFDLWFGAGTRIDYDGRFAVDRRAEPMFPRLDRRQFSPANRRSLRRSLGEIVRPSISISIPMWRSHKGSMQCPDGGNGKTNASSRPAMPPAYDDYPHRQRPRIIRSGKTREHAAAPPGRRFATLELCGRISESAGLGLGRNGRAANGPNHARCFSTGRPAWAKPISWKAFGPRRAKIRAIYRPSIFRPSNLPAIFSKPCAAADCPASAANIAAWDC